MTTAVPSADVLGAMLARVTGVLARELANPTERTPDWSDAEWRLARAVCAIQGISGLLCTCLRWSDAPGPWRSFLEQQRDHTAVRHRRMREVLLELDSAAKTHGIPILGMKGSALQRLDVYAPGERPMSDIDLLAHPADAAGVAQILCSIGFREDSVTERHVTFVPVASRAPSLLGECAANDVKIELHTRAWEQLGVCSVDATESIFPKNTDSPGVHSYPSIPALMFHLALHTAGNIGLRTLRLLQLHDLARVSARLTASDWEEVVRLAGRDERQAWWLFPPLSLMHRYAGAAPQPLLDYLRSGCPRTLTGACEQLGIAELSLCHPWIVLFPGLFWTRTVPEALQYVWSRLFNTPVAVHTRALRENPSLVNTRWNRLSRLGRLARWARGRVPRVGTLSAVEAAFADAI